MKNIPNPELIDDENPQWTESMFKEAKSAAELFPHLIPKKSKVNLSITYDADVISAFKATGENWQTKMNDVLREWVNSHPTKLHNEQIS
jgi:uncharacterized protein (DUF4415 family)